MSNTGTKNLLLSRQAAGQLVDPNANSNNLTYRTFAEDKDLRIEVEIPGVDPAEVEVNCDASVLFVEAPTGTMSISIDAALNIDEIKANIKWGLLTLSIPRRSTRSVKINLLDGAEKAPAKPAPKTTKKIDTEDEEG